MTHIKHAIHCSNLIGLKMFHIRIDEVMTRMKQESHICYL